MSNFLFYSCATSNVCNFENCLRTFITVDIAWSTSREKTNSSVCYQNDIGPLSSRSSNLYSLTSIDEKKNER